MHEIVQRCTDTNLGIHIIPGLRKRRDRVRILLFTELMTACSFSNCEITRLVLLGIMGVASGCATAPLEMEEEDDMFRERPEAAPELYDPEPDDGWTDEDFEYTDDTEGMLYEQYHAAVCIESREIPSCSQVQRRQGLPIGRWLLEKVERPYESEESHDWIPEHDSLEITVAGRATFLVDHDLCDFWVPFDTYTRHEWPVRQFYDRNSDPPSVVEISGPHHPARLEWTGCGDSPEMLVLRDGSTTLTYRADAQYVVPVWNPPVFHPGCTEVIANIRSLCANDEDYASFVEPVTNAIREVCTQQPAEVWTCAETIEETGCQSYLEAVKQCGVRVTVSVSL